ncbi:peptidoglycan DD-metalloendopeptidase family protein, partial [Candidatus Parcubacteria bacterium]|nr:peptidoglycan DD-metalloendopeptidase family protein [Candidatus Parcubacteria bacterium]
MHKRLVILIIALLLIAPGAQLLAEQSAADIAAAAAAAAEEAARAAEAKAAQDLKDLIDQKNKELAAIEAEIAGYQKEIEKTGKESDTLRSALAQLETNRKKLLAEIKATEAKVSVANATIRQLDTDITDKNTRLDRSEAALAASLRGVYELESVNVVQVLLSHRNFSDVWEDIDNLNTVGENLNEHIAEVKKLKQGLETNKAKKEAEKKKLQSLQRALADQKKVVENNKVEKNKVLTETQNKESEYQRLLAERYEKKVKLEQEILEVEGKLKVDVDLGKLPHTGSGVLSFPLDKITVTQYFGKTAFATQNPQVYNGSGHNGVDFRASVGTPVKAALAGEVTGTGDTDKACYGVSYGRWVLIRHDNGLSTLYAHLDLIKVVPGQKLETGDVVGYSGNTGYSTGPHLHFTVYASQAVHISGATEYIP